MTLAVTFVTPLLLIGLLAAGIPPLLHLLSRARAKEVPFPTLRFLHLSMEKTARRRKLRQWLLMALRCGVLALLAMSVAEPISRAAGTWWSGTGGSAVVVLDNSMSMSAAAGEGGKTRLALAKAQAASLLDGPARPGIAGVLTTNGGLVSTELTTRLDLLRQGLADAPASVGRALLAQRVQAAAGLLSGQVGGRKSLYVFSDLQKVSFQELVSLPAGTAGEAIDLVIVDTASPQTANVAVSDLRVTGQGVVGAVMTFTAELVNSAAAERIVDVGFQPDASSPPRAPQRTRE